MNIYLDIDGVLIAQNGKAAYYADEFLAFITTHWPDNIYWLTSYCWKGIDRTSEVLEPVLRRKTLPLLKHIKPTNWNDLKTDAINFKQPFLWFDDNLYGEEEKILKHYNALLCHRRINLERDPLQLLDEIVYLRSLA